MNGVLIALDRQFPASAPRITCACCGGVFPEQWQVFLNADGQRICEAACKPSAVCKCSCHVEEPPHVGKHVVACCAAPASGVMGTSLVVAEWFGMTPEDQERAADLALGVERRYPPTLAAFAEAIENAVTPKQAKKKSAGKVVPTKPTRRARSTRDVSTVDEVEDPSPSANSTAPVETTPPVAPAPAASPPPADDEKEAKFRRMVSLLGALFVARKDVYAIEHNGTWMPARKDMYDTDSPCLKMSVKAFRGHFYGDVCMGTYLLDLNNCVKFMAFDVDLRTKDAIYFPVRDSEELEMFLSDHSAEDPVAVNGVLELEAQIGNLEEALHNKRHVGHRWARIQLDAHMKRIARVVRDMLGLPTINVVTGGGGHVLVPFGTPTPAAEARQAARSVMEEIDYSLFRGENFWIPGGENPPVEIETFPKQDTMPSSGGFGNLIRLPFGKHHATGKRSYLTWAGPYDLPGGNPWDLPKVDAIKTLEDAAASLNLEVTS